MQFKPVYFRMEQAKRKCRKKNEANILKENSKYSKTTLTLKQIVSDGSCHELESAKLIRNCTKKRCLG
jgi:hypothetical protein